MLGTRAILLLSLTGAVGCLGQAPSNQPQFRAPWRGGARVIQGNLGATSHNTCGRRSWDGTNCAWENTYALDIDLNYAEVLAPADGEVAFVKDNTVGLGGRQMGLRHLGPAGGEFTTVYLHLSEILVRSGAVAQGQPIARSGASSAGTESGRLSPHLHFHLWPGPGSGSADSHTMPIENLLLRRVGSEAGFRSYDARSRELDDVGIAGGFFESSADCGGGVSTFRVAAGPPVHPAGTLVKTASSATVYVLRGPDDSYSGVYRIGLSSPAVLRNLYNQPSAGDQFVFNEVITIGADEMSRYPERGTLSAARSLPGNGRPHPDGQLITRPRGGEISIVSNGVRRPFSILEKFLGLGYKPCNVFLDANYDTYPQGPSVEGTPAAEGDLLDIQARRDMFQRKARDQRFGDALLESFAKDVERWVEWELRWMGFRFSRNRVVGIFHATYKNDSSYRYTIFWDPDVAGWTAWERE